MSELIQARSHGRTSQILFIVVLVAIGAVLLGWCVYFPYDARLLDLVVPPVWQWTSRHEAVAQRWEGLAQDPLAQLLWNGLVGSSVPFSTLPTDPEWSDLAKLLMQRRVVLCWTPALPESGASGWILAGWVGWKGALIRSGLLPSLTRRFSRRSASGGVTVWTAPSCRTDWGKHVSMSVVEGVGILAVSDDPLAATYSARRVRMRLRPCAVWHPEFHGTSDEAIWQSAFRLNPRVRRLHFSVGGWGTEKEVEIRGRAEMLDLPPLTLPDAVVETVPGRDADLRITLPLGWLRWWLEAGPRQENPARELLNRTREWASDESPAFACVWGGERSVRWFGIRVPTVMVGFRAQPGIVVLDSLKGMLSSAVRQAGWRVTPRERRTNDLRVVEFDLRFGAEGLGFGPEGLFTLSEGNGWVIAAYPQGLMSEIVSLQVDPGSSATATAATPSEAWSLRLQADADRTIPALRDGLAAWELGRFATGGERHPLTRRWAEWLRKEEESLRGLGRASLRLRSQAGTTEFQLRLAYER